MTLNTNIAKRAKDNLETLMGGDSFQKSLRDVIPKHLSPDRVVKTALVAASRQPKLFECTPQSFLQSVMTSAELGLDCTGTLGQGYLVPYFNSNLKAFECQFIAGYQGLINLARRSGQIKRIESRIVYEKDKFEVNYGLQQNLTHKPYLGGERGKIVCVYAIAELADGSSQLEIMTIDEVNRIKDRSKAKSSGPWITDFGEMARKTVVRRIAKYLPLSPELVKALEFDDQQFDFDNHGGAARDIQAGVSGLKERLKVDSKEVTEEAQPQPDPDPDLEKKKQEQLDRLKGKKKEPEPEPQEEPNWEDTDPLPKEEEPVSKGYKYKCLRCGNLYKRMPASGKCKCLGDVAQLAKEEVA